MKVARYIPSPPRSCPLLPPIHLQPRAPWAWSPDNSAPLNPPLPAAHSPATSDTPTIPSTLLRSVEPPGCLHAPPHLDGESRCSNTHSLPSLLNTPCTKPPSCSDCTELLAVAGEKTTVTPTGLLQILGPTLPPCAAAPALSPAGGHPLTSPFLPASPTFPSLHHSPYQTQAYTAQPRTTTKT